MRAAVTIAGMALVLGGLTGCGGSDDGGGSSASDDASKEDFCEAFNGFYEKVVAKATDADSSGMIKALKEWAADIEDVGIPSEMPEDARNGFEVFVESARDIDGDATFEDLKELGNDLGTNETQDAEAFGDWTTENCPIDLPGLPAVSDLPSDLPTELPSDLPTDPSELESMMSELTASAGS